MPFNIYDHPAQQITSSDTRVQKIIVDPVEGILLELEGHRQPHRGMPSQEAVRAIDVVKKLIRSPLLLFPGKLLKVSLIVLGPHILQEQYMQPCSRELRRIITGDWGTIISHVIEYDNAYRVRLQAMLASIDKEDLVDRPWWALRKMSYTNWYDDYPSVHKKIRLSLVLVALALCWPPFRRQWVQIWTHCLYERLLPTPIDRYWLSKRTDYGPNNVHRQRYSNI